MPQDPKFLRPAEAAELLSISRSKAYQLIKSGELPAQKIGRSVRVPLAAIHRLSETAMAGSGGLRALTSA